VEGGVGRGGEGAKKVTVSQRATWDWGHVTPPGTRLPWRTPLPVSALYSRPSSRAAPQ